MNELNKLVRFWQKEARRNLSAERAYKKQKPIGLNHAAFEKGLALAKQQCADQLKSAIHNLSSMNIGANTP